MAEQEQYGIGRTQDTGARAWAGGSGVGQMGEVPRSRSFSGQQRFVYWGLAFAAFVGLPLVAAAFGFAHRPPSGQVWEGLLEDESATAASSGVQLVNRVDAGLDVDLGPSGSPSGGRHLSYAGISASVSASASGIVSASPPVVRQPPVKPNPVPSPSRLDTDDMVTGLKIKEDL